ncbi:MipA/OmpV family protein [Janthinobacterium sp. PSPC1-1]|uniref:MipA/OmpV family protein n=1 Tax=Janthinobacterium sp. PSPC1-1 TaxID=2804581 RepID=UPI003CF20B96
MAKNRINEKVAADIDRDMDQTAKLAQIKDVRAKMSVSYAYSKAVALTAGVTFSELENDAKDSPVVRKNHDVSSVFAVTYGF